MAIDGQGGGQGAEEIDLEHLTESVGALLVQCPGLGRAGVVQQAIDATEGVQSDG